MSLVTVQGKNVAVIGAGLLGSEICRACARDGADVAIADIEKPRIISLVEELSGTYPGQRFLAYEADATSEKGLRGFAQEAQSRLGRVDGIVNTSYPRTAAYGRKFAVASVDDMVENASLHIKTCMATMQAFSDVLKVQRGGSVVFFGSIYGLRAPRFDIYEGTGMTMPAEYAAAKAGIISLTKYFAALYGEYHVRVNAVSPGGIADRQPASFVERYGSHTVLGEGLLSPSDIVGALVFLLSDASSKMTGQNLVVDAGWTL